jgi:hypothetical protein
VLKLVFGIKKENRQMLLENKVLRRMFGSKRDDMTGDRRKLHNEQLPNLYSSPSIIKMAKSRRIRLGRTRSTHESEEECIQDFSGKERGH